MTAPAPPPVPRPAGSPRKTPSITRQFAATFIAIALAGLAIILTAWLSARRTEAEVLRLTHQLEQLERRQPSRALEAQIAEMQEIAAGIGDDAIQAAAATTVIFLAVLVSFGIAFW